jgi:hypothetical protein
LHVLWMLRRVWSWDGECYESLEGVGGLST